MSELARQMEHEALFGLSPWKLAFSRSYRAKIRRLLLEGSTLGDEVPALLQENNALYDELAKMARELTDLTTAE